MKENEQTKEKTKFFRQVRLGAAGLRERLKKGGGVLADSARRADAALWDLFKDDFAVPEKRSRKNLILLGIASALIGATVLPVLARFASGAYPAPIALLSSLGGSLRSILKKRGAKDAALVGAAAEWTVLLGVLFTSLFLPHGFFVFLIGLSLYLLRAGITGGRMDDSPLSRVTVAAGAGALLGMVTAALDGFTASALLSGAITGLTAPVFTYLLSGFYAFSRTLSRTGKGKADLALYSAAGALLFLSLYALRDLAFFGFSPAGIAAGVIAFLFARQKGPLFGAGVGFVAGVACGDGAFFAAAGFASGLFFPSSDPAALMIGSAAAGGAAILFGGVEHFAFYFGDLALSAGISYFAARALPKKKTAPERVPAFGENGSKNAAKKKLKEMSEAFSSLSEVFYTVSDSLKKPTLPEVTRLVANACSEICSGCALSGVCWGKDAALSNESAARLAASLLSSGKIEAKDLDEPFATKCLKRTELLSLFTKRFERLNGTELKNNKTKMLAGEYSAVSHLLRSGAAVIEKEAAPAPGLEARLAAALREMKIDCRRVQVLGRREITADVVGVFPDRIRFSGAETARRIGAALGCEMEPPALLFSENECTMRLRRKKAIRLECAKSGCRKKGEAVSGDFASFFETDRGLFYALICDGMGSGREAAYTSRLAAIFLEKLLSCSSPKSVTLEMLNSFLLAKTDEVFTTVDLLEVDLFTAEGAFIKAGAAPSYVFREGRIHRVASQTPPAGILSRPVAQQTKITLMPGDLVLMISDGASSGEREEAELIRHLSGLEFSSAKALCDEVFSFARDHASFRDDMTVTALRIEKN